MNAFPVQYATPLGASVGIMRAFRMPHAIPHTSRRPFAARRLKTARLTFSLAYGVGALLAYCALVFFGWTGAN